jgi:hypothetical protein
MSSADTIAARLMGIADNASNAESSLWTAARSNGR